MNTREMFLEIGGAERLVQKAKGIPGIKTDWFFEEMIRNEFTPERLDDVPLELIAAGAIEISTIFLAK